MIVQQPAVFQIGGKRVSGVFRRACEKVVHRGVVEADRQNAILEAVVVKDVGKARRDKHAEAVVRQRPRRMLAARAAAKVAARHKDAGAAELGAVQFENGVLASIVAKTPVEEQILAKSGSLDSLEELLGDDLVGIDI